MYYSVVYLDRTGHWSFSEDIDIDTRVQIVVDRNDLYDVEFPDVRMMRLLELLMRRYTGLFSYPVPIDENYIASQIGVQVPMLRQLLYQLSLLHVIRYVPCDHATVIFLHHDRLRPKNVNLEPKRYAMLKSAATGRMEKMIDYVSQTDVCRSAYLLDYFGQSESADCGTCDVCRAKSAGTRKSSSDLASEIATYINDEMSGEYRLNDILSRFAVPGRHSNDECIAILRQLLDRSEVPPPMI